MNELETLGWMRDGVEAPRESVRAAARAPWDGALADVIDHPRARRSTFGWRFAIAAAVATAVVAAGVFVTRQRIDSVKPRHILAVTSLEPAGPMAPAVFLFVGSDSRAFVQSGSDASQFGDPATEPGSRSDTMMLVRIDPAAGKVLVVSIPRDLFVTIPGCGFQKVNAAFNADLHCASGARGGTQLLVDTLSTGLGVPVNHVIEVQFPQFAALVDQLGGLRIEFPVPARDRETGLDEAAGCQTLSGNQALSFVRSRHFEQFTGSWQYDTRSDLGRMARQQLALRQLAAAAVARSGTDPRPLLRSLFEHVTVDSGFTADDALQFARALHSYQAVTVTLPGTLAMHDDQQGFDINADSNAVLHALAAGSALPASVAATDPTVRTYPLPRPTAC